MSRLLTLLFAVSLGLSAQAASPEPPISARTRVDWFVVNTVGPQSLAGGLFSAALGTWRNSPVEYGPHWKGFGQRYGIRLTGIAVNNAIEAGVGSLWGEDPRYRRMGENAPMKQRALHVIRWTFVAANKDGEVHPAYARYVAWTGGSFASAAWRPDSDSDVRASVQRIYLGVALQMTGNAFREFMPDLKRLRRHSGQPAPAHN